MNRSEFWNDIYSRKNESQQSWFQLIPEQSLKMIADLHLDKKAAIIDIGGGESRLVDFLLAEGYSDLTVLDVSQESLEKSKARLGKKSEKVQWITSDVTKFQTTSRFDLWHDRAAFHFLTEPDDIKKYVHNTYNALQVGGHLIISTFSETGPEKCSGLPITKYSQRSLKDTFESLFEFKSCMELTHTTPWDSKQDFIYCCFKKVR